MADLISRALALEVISAVNSITWSQSGKVLCGKMYSQIKDLPAVDAAQVVHGRWQEKHVDYASDCAIDELQSAKCSVCGLYHTAPYMYYFSDYKFCPNCGARMDAGDEDG